MEVTRGQRVARPSRGSPALREQLPRGSNPTGPKRHQVWSPGTSAGARLRDRDTSCVTFSPPCRTYTWS